MALQFGGAGGAKAGIIVGGAVGGPVGSVLGGTVGFVVGTAVEIGLVRAARAFIAKSRDSGKNTQGSSNKPAKTGT